MQDRRSRIPSAPAQKPYPALGLIITMAAMVAVFPAASASRPADIHAPIVVAIDREFEPYEFVDLNGKISGFNIDLLNAIGELAGVKFQYVPMSRLEALSKLEDGRIELLNMIRTPARDSMFEYSLPHHHVSQAIFHHKNVDIPGIGDLSGHTVAFRKYSVVDETFAARNDFKKITVENNETGLLKLNSGKIDAFVAAEAPCTALMQDYNLDNIEISSTDVFAHDYCFVARKGNRPLIGLLDAKLQLMKASGAYQLLLDKWFKKSADKNVWLIRHRTHFLVIGIALGMMIVAGFAWNFTLHRAVRSQTRSIRESEERYRLATEAGNIAAWQALPPHMRLESDGVIEALLGYAKGELHDLSALAQPDDGARMLSQWRGLLSGSVNRCTMEVSLKHADGFPRWMLIQCQAVCAEDGGLLKIVGTLQDVTDRKNSEEAYRQTQSLLQTVLNNAPISLYALDKNGVFTLAESKGFDRKGSPATQIAGVSAFDLYESFHFVENTGAVLSVRDIIRRALDGEKLLVYSDIQGNHYENRLGPMVDPSGSIVGVVGVATDITDRKAIEDTLRRRDADLNEAQRIGRIGSWEWETAGGTTWWSDEYYRIFERNPMLGPVPFEEHVSVYTPESAACLQAEVARSLQTGGSYQADVEMICANGARRWITVRGEAKIDALGMVVGIHGTAQDITERKLAEHANRRTQQILKAYSERLRMLSHKLLTLQEAERREIARELHDEMGQSLTGLHIMLELNQTHCLDPLKGSLADAQMIVRDILSRVRDLSLDLHPSIIDDLGLTAGVRWFVDRWTKRTGIDVDLAINGGNENLTAEAKINTFRILQEALMNVAKHSGAKHVKIRLYYKGTGVEGSIHDDGTGFLVEHGRIDAAMGKSLGILSMQERADLIGGELEILSAPERGTTIRFAIPDKGECVNKEQSV